ncbi:MAG: DUF3526 domain-containing protein [Bacteroidetes bacterium]|nr:DUF3526 domain-containing protein [Bacteroidota bacterium]
MFTTILKYELKYFLRNKIISVLFAVLIAITFYALYNGSTFYKKQTSVIEKLKVKDSTAFQTIIQNFKAGDTLTADAKWKYKNLQRASWAIFDNRFNVFWQPKPISVINIGNRDVYPYYQEIMPVSLYMRLFKNEISNPNSLLIGNIDFSYVILFLMPLFIISLLFNFISENKEKGIQSFLETNATSFSNYLYCRLAFYILIIVAILLLLFSMAYFLFFKDVSGILFLKIFIYSIFYSLFWIVICFGVNKLNKTSVFNISFLISLWLCFSILIPSVANQVAAYKYPINTEEISKNIRRVQLNGDNKEYSNVLKKFYSKYPQYYNNDTSETTLFSLAYLAQGQLSDLEGDSLLNGICEKMLLKQKFLKRISYLDPCMYLQNKYADLTETNLIDYVDYLKRLQRFNKELKLFYFKKAFTDDKMDLTYYQKMPKWK